MEFSPKLPKPNRSTNLCSLFIFECKEALQIQIGLGPTVVLAPNKIHLLLVFAFNVQILNSTFSVSYRSLRGLLSSCKHAYIHHVLLGTSQLLIELCGYLPCSTKSYVLVLIVPFGSGHLTSPFFKQGPRDLIALLIDVY